MPVNLFSPRFPFTQRGGSAAETCCVWVWTQTAHCAEDCAHLFHLGSCRVGSFQTICQTWQADLWDDTMRAEPDKCWEHLRTQLYREWCGQWLVLREGFAIGLVQHGGWRTRWKLCGLGGALKMKPPSGAWREDVNEKEKQKRNKQKQRKKKGKRENTGMRNTESKWTSWVWGKQVPKTKGLFHLKVNRYYGMKSIRNGKLKIDSEGGKKEEIELPWSGGRIGWGGGGLPRSFWSKMALLLSGATPPSCCQNH